jgi:hypothetical protein
MMASFAVFTAHKKVAGKTNFYYNTFSFFKIHVFLGFFWQTTPKHFPRLNELATFLCAVTMPKVVLILTNKLVEQRIFM